MIRVIKVFTRTLHLNEYCNPPIGCKSVVDSPLFERVLRPNFIGVFYVPSETAQQGENDPLFRLVFVIRSNLTPLFFP